MCLEGGKLLITSAVSMAQASDQKAFSKYRKLRLFT
jgi:hypothetical protein